MPRILANGIQVHYQQAGEGPDVVLIHGLTADLSMWYAGLMQRLAKEFRVTVYDLRGHGYSDLTPTGYTSAQLGGDLAALMDSLELQSAHLVGHSFGAAVATHCAVLYPERVSSLVLADPTLPVLVEFLNPEEWPYLEGALTMLKEQGMSIPKEKWSDLEYITREWLAAGSPSPFGLRRDTPGRANRRLVRLLDDSSAFSEAHEVAGLTLDRMGEIRRPTLAIFGEASRFIQTAGLLTEKIPGCEVDVVKEAAHFFALVKPDVMAAHVTAFIKGQKEPDVAHPSQVESIKAVEKR